MDPRLVLSTVNVLPINPSFVHKLCERKSYKEIVSEVKGECSRKEHRIGRNKSSKISCPDITREQMCAPVEA